MSLPVVLRCTVNRLIGCYEALDGGDLSEALADFTGGVSETVDLTNEAYQTDEDQRDRFYDWLSRAIDNNSLMCAAITVSRQSINESLLVITQQKLQCSSTRLLTVY